MFEKESYNFEVLAEPLREGDMFFNHEVGTWKFDNRIYAILALSLILNLGFLGFAAQSNLLMAKGCDSPWVGRVCQVLDMAYVGAVLFGTEREYADAVYERTQMEDVEVTWIDQTGVEPQFTYPEGYFYQEASTDPFAVHTSNAFNTNPGFPMTNPIPGGSSLIDTPPIAPKTNPNAVTGNLPDSPFDLSDTGTDTASKSSNRKSSGKKGSANANKDQTVAGTNTNTNTEIPEPNPDETATADKNGIFLNKRPLRIKAEETIADVDANKIKLDSGFKVAVEGTLGFAKDGKTIVLKNPKPIVDKAASPNDPAMEKFVRDWILAVGDSGWLGYLEKLDNNKLKSKRIVITVSQNDAEFTASVRSELSSPDEANSLSSSLMNLMTLGAFTASGDELTFLKAAKPTSDGNALVLNFSMPKPLAQEMIQRKLAEHAAGSKKPNGNAMTTQNGNTAAK